MDSLKDYSEFLGFQSASRSQEDPLFGFEIPLHRKDGKMLTTLKPSWRRETKARHRLLSMTRNISGRKLAEEALRVSEEKFSKIFYLSPDSITINRLDDGVYLDVNQGFTEILGYGREDVLGHSSLPGDLGIWADKSDRERLLVEIQSHGEALGFEAQFRRKNGTVITGLMSSKLLEVNGERWLLSMTRDISERKQTEGTLRETAQRLELATASGKLGIWDHNLLDGTLIWDNQMFEIYGLDRETYQPSHESWRTRVQMEDLAAVEEATRSAIAGLRPYDAEFRVNCPNGSLRYIKANGIVIHDTEGKATRMIGINRDRTEQKEAELEHQRLQAELQHAEKLESIGSLAGGIAHDMNNVLAAIMIMTSLLREKCAEGDPMAKGLDTIQSASCRGRDLVKSLTDFARKGLEEQRPCDLNEILHKEMDLLRRTTLQKVQIVQELEASLPLILGDASALGNAVMNLSINALDAMPQGGTLCFRSRSIRGEKVELAVTDTGVGMPPEVLSKAMEPFFTTKPTGKGTGLGLARVYGTIKAHGGSVDILSKPGEGTTVFLRLPAIFQAGAGESQQLATTLGGAELSRRILLVDDEELMRETIPLLLESMNHKVETVSSGQDALRCLDAGLAVDLVLLDHNMPGLTGVETLTQLRTNRPKLPVILSTGFINEDTANVLAGISHVWVLKKPYGKREIQQVMAEVFQPKR